MNLPCNTESSAQVIGAVGETAVYAPVVVDQNVTTVVDELFARTAIGKMFSAAFAADAIPGWVMAA